MNPDETFDLIISLVTRYLTDDHITMVNKEQTVAAIVGYAITLIAPRKAAGVALFEKLKQHYIAIKDEEQLMSN